MTDRELCEEFRQKWSLERVQNMTLDEYTSIGGAKRDDFCYWIERKLDSIGSIWGGSSFKFGIYKCNKDEEQRADGKRIYADGYAWLKKYGDTKETAFDEIKSRIAKIIKASLDNDLVGIDSIDFGVATKWKIAFHYQNLDDMKIINIFKEDWLKTIAEQELGDKNLSIPQIYTKILAGKIWDIESIHARARELWVRYFDSRNYWIYKAGEQGSKWQKMYDEGLMGIGWRKLGDLSGYKDGEELESKLKEIYPTSAQARYNDTLTNWDFCHTIKEGDIIIAASGRDTLLGYGEVVSGYFYDESIDDEFASFREVDWRSDNRVWKVDGDDRLVIKTLTNITKYEGYPQKLLEIMQAELGDFSMQSKNIAESKNIPLNQILFGPPGTGKTYHSINKALEILQSYGQLIPESRKEQKELFDKFRQNGQIGFVTFHQSYGYEEFVEGIRPRLSGENDESQISEKMEYEIKDGIFKRMCKEASKNYENSQKTKEQIKQDMELDDLIKAYVDYVREQCDKRDYVSLKDEHINTDKNIIDVQSYKTGNFSFIVAIGFDTKKDYLTKDKIKSNYEKFKNNEIKSWENIIGIDDKYTKKLYFSLLKRLKEFENKKHENFTESNTENIDNRLKPYTLIIDEINRGNISKILGELITLLEPSKRIGSEEELRVRLPYSGDEFDRENGGFGVPQNLYIIGTMNTADRSIALLDTALRRRFEFIEMMPDSSVLENESCDGVDLCRLLDSINKRISFLLDREYQIGHSYLLNVGSLENLRAAFSKKILPLLQEYFYDDYAKINAVLNNNEMIKSQTQQDLGIKLDDEFVDSQKKVWSITDSSKWAQWQFQKIYDTNAKPAESKESPESSNEPSE